MTTERNIKKSIRAVKIWAGLYIVLGVWTTVVSAIILITYERGAMAKIAAYCAIITGPLILLNGFGFVYVALKGSVGSGVAIKRTLFVLKCSLWLPAVCIEALALVSVVCAALDLSLRSVGEKWLCINLIIVSVVALILPLTVGMIALTHADNFKTATTLNAGVQPLSQPLEQQQQHMGGFSRGRDLPSQTAYKIFYADRNVNNSTMPELIPPPCYDTLSEHSSVVRNYEPPPTYSAERTPPPSYSSFANIDNE